MNTQRYKVTNRSKWHDFAVSLIDDFSTIPEGIAVAQDLVENPNISLYSLDLENRLAVFVETPVNVNLESFAFMFRGQFENASHLLTVSFENLYKLAEEIETQEETIFFIHSVGRCGSTLVSKAFEALPDVRSLSEPDALTLLVGWRSSGKLSEEEISKLVSACIKFCCKQLTGTENCKHWAIKFRSQCVKIADLMASIFPNAKHVYLTRDPLSWLDSAYRAFIDPDQVDDPEYKLLFEGIFAEMYQLVRDMIVEGQPMEVSKTWMLNWIANMETQQRLKANGQVFCEADFAEIKSQPEAVIRRIFNHCALEVENWKPVLNSLNRDSQAGSSLSQKTINRPEKLLPKHSHKEAKALLIERGHMTDNSK